MMSIPNGAGSTLRVSRRQPVRSNLQYVGFTQNGTIRAYQFRRVEPGEETREFVVSADLALFTRHHIGIQDGPELSLSHLLATPEPAEGCAWPAAQELTEQDLARIADLRHSATKGHK